MAERTIAAILREIAQVKAADLSPATRSILLTKLKAEADAFADSMERQGELVLMAGIPPGVQPGAAANAAAEGAKRRDK